MSLAPEFVSDAHRIDAELCPPSNFVSGAVQLAMMGAAERNGELVAHLLAQACWLRKAQVVGV